MSQVIADLKAVRELLAVPNRWTKGTDARDDFGAIVRATHHRACCWCISGAANRIVDGIGPRYDAVMQPLRDAAHVETLDVWNDAPERTHDDVLALLDGTIARLEGAE